ncbi:MAG TPA: hypothetical protein VM101_07885 [Flavitalea sp.]|nr:hypothetical protein [Flavitalea sp.]
MNKYLLLRDNKQSGPYTVPELAEKGIKPYDLVWLDGKSIAWRYPSEIDELKAFAPAVEEQPFDRFYKKPEVIEKAAPAAAAIEHAGEPAVAAQVSKENTQQKKVYINFPVGNHAENKIVPEKKVIIPETAQEPLAPVTFAEKTNYIQPVERIPSYSPSSQSNRKYIYYAVAAAVLLTCFVTVLLINNNQQQQRLKELNTIVKEIESKKANELAALTTQVKDLAPVQQTVQPQTSETIINPELLTNDDYSKPQKETVVTADAVVLTPKKPVQPVESSSGVTFKERPVLRRTDKEENATPAVSEKEEASPSSENMYKLVSIKPNNYKTGVLGGISNLQFEVTNNSKHELQKVAIEIKYLGPEKKVVNTQTVYIENVSAGGHATIDVPKSKRGVSINYTVTDIKS